jgi:hypothetical protein
MPLRRRRPLLRAAAVGGGAYYMGKRRAEEQQPAVAPEGAPYAGQAQAQPGAADAGLDADAVQRLKELANLREQGVLTDEEFAAQKARILG